MRVTVIRPKDVDQSGICANTIPQDDTKVAPLLPGTNQNPPTLIIHSGYNNNVKLYNITILVHYNV